ncbi:MAG TPA: class I SAM-dependent methyltransferase [Candidatus Angelobacter sp.]|nr:class I SAM-dependent methyltransferase [Candidatus Angelobacter sp.]
METLEHCNICSSRQIRSIDPEYNLCRCQDCGYVFDSPRPTIEEIVTFYSKKGQYDHWLREDEARVAIWTWRLGKLKKYLPLGRLLDVGAGIGEFLHYAQPFFSEVTGTEVSSAGVEVASQKFGVNVRRGQVENMDLPLGYFDMISIFHVLEHVPNPVSFLARLRELLCPGGLVVCAVPNDVLAWRSRQNSLGKRLGRKKFKNFSAVLGTPKVSSVEEIHLSHFTAPVLGKLFKDSGFEIVEESVDPYFLRTGLRGLKDRLRYGFHWLLCRVFRLNRYDTIWFVARKGKASNQGK